MKSLESRKMGFAADNVSESLSHANHTLELLRKAHFRLKTFSAVQKQSGNEIKPPISNTFFKLILSHLTADNYLIYWKLALITFH